MERAIALNNVIVRSEPPLPRNPIDLVRCAFQLDAAPARAIELLQAYADGVNEYLASHPLPQEYAELELTSARPWEPIDSLVIGKAIAASLSLDVDIGPTLQLQGFIAAGIAGGFDGQTLF